MTRNQRSELSRVGPFLLPIRVGWNLGRLLAVLEDDVTKSVLCA